MNANVRLGRIWGIPIGLHGSWFLIFGLLTWSLAGGYFPQAYEMLPTAAHWLLAVITSILFFGSVLAHELGHAHLALRNGLPVRSITLFIFGGVAQIGAEPKSPGVEFRIAIAGPVVSALLAAVFGGLYLLDRQIPFLAAPSEYLLRINLMLALFNLIPGFPLDGGRVLRAIVWALTKSYDRATRVASLGGQLVAFGFIAFGIWNIFSGQFFNGLWLAFIGWFLQNAATTAYAQVEFQSTLQGVTVGEVMDRQLTRVHGLTTINQVVSERVLPAGEQYFQVYDEALQQPGLVTLNEIAAVPQAQWRFTPIQRVMAPLSRAVKISPDTELITALQVMESNNLVQIPVTVENDLVGVLSRERVANYLRLRAQLRI